jgi:hypothetical protein
MQRFDGPPQIFGKALVVAIARLMLSRTAIGTGRFPCSWLVTSSLP